MSWITLTTDDLLAGLSGPEKSALQTAAKAVGQGDPLAEHVANVTNEVRGYVAACAKNSLGPDGTLPSELKSDAVAIARWRAATRLNIASILSPAREKEYDNANTKMRDVAKCAFAIIAPATPAAAQASGTSVQVVSSTTRQATRDKLNSL